MRKSGKGGAFVTVHRHFFPLTYMRPGNGLKTLNIHYKVSWNILKHKFIILKLKFELFWMVNKNFQRGCFSHAHPDDQNNVTECSFWLQKEVKFWFGNRYQIRDLRVAYYYTCLFLEKMKFTPFTEVWVLTPFWERFSWSEWSLNART